MTAAPAKAHVPLIIEGIEEAVMKGGGYVLFTGCAAGDTGAAIVLKVQYAGSELNREIGMPIPVKGAVTNEQQ